MADDRAQITVDEWVVTLVVPRALHADEVAAARRVLERGLGSVVAAVRFAVPQAEVVVE